MCESSKPTLIKFVSDYHRVAKLLINLQRLPLKRFAIFNMKLDYRVTRQNYTEIIGTIYKKSSK